MLPATFACRLQTRSCCLHRLATSAIRWCTAFDFHCPLQLPVFWPCYANEKCQAPGEQAAGIAKWMSNILERPLQMSAF